MVTDAEGYPPPAVRPLVELDVPEDPHPPVLLSPQSIAFPSLAIVIYSISN